MVEQEQRSDLSCEKVSFPIWFSNTVILYTKTCFEDILQYQSSHPLNIHALVVVLLLPACPETTANQQHSHSQCA